MAYYWHLIAALGVWRLTHLFQAEDGPWDLITRLRRLAGRSVVGALLDCFLCLSLWIAAPFAYFVGETWKERALLWPALSAVAILLERLMTPPARGGELPVVYREDAMPDASQPSSTAAEK